MRIIRELDSPKSPPWNLRISYADISRKLGVDEETIRLRVKRARERGAFPTWQLMINPQILGCDMVSVELDVDAEETKAKVISQIRLVDGVTKIHDYHGKGIQVCLYSEPGEPLSRKIRLIESICGSSASARWTSRFPEPSMRMRKTDWRIVKALREDPGRDLADVATSVGTTHRTIQRRLSKMREGKAIFLSGDPHVGAVTGLVCCFVVFCPDARSKRAVDARIRADFKRMGHIDSSPDDYSIIGMPCENLAEADRALGKLRTMTGVKDADMRIMRDLILVPDWLASEVDRRIAAPSALAP